MPDRASVFEAIQIGVEPTPGSQVPALKRLLSTYVEPAPQVTLTPHRNTGTKYNTAFQIQKEHTTAALTGVVSFNDIVYVLSGILCTPVITIPTRSSQTGVLTRRWTFRPQVWGPDTNQTFTIEHGSTVFAERFVYGLFQEMRLRFTSTEAALTGSMLGQKLQENVILSGSGSQVAIANPTATFTATPAAGSGLTDPTTPTPTATATTGGSLANNTNYRLTYTFTNANGETLPFATGGNSYVVINTGYSGNAFTVGAITMPTGATGVKWYFSDVTTTALRLVQTNTGQSFTITSVAASNQPLPPSSNTTGSGLPAGAYSIEYTFQNAAGGETAPSTPVAATVTSGQVINVSALTPSTLPAGTVQVNWYVEAPGGSTYYFYISELLGSATFSITALPAGNARSAPTANNTSASVSNIPDLPVDPANVSVLVGSTVNGLTQLTRCLEAEVNFANRFGMVTTLDANTPSYSSHVERAPDFTGMIHLEHDSVSVGFMQNLRNKTEMFCRLLMYGPVIETIAGVPFSYMIQVTFPFKFGTNPTRGDFQDIYANQFPLENRNDDGFGTSIEVVVDTALTSL